MKHIITDKYTNRILNISDKISTDSVGNIIDDTGTGYFEPQVTVYELEGIPSYVSVYRYKYTKESGFVEDTSYGEKTPYERLVSVEANIDYIMLLNDSIDE